ncbi:MAG: hypothetical protein ACYCW6_28165 [Candidatus Xenobia bacterium]
MISSVGRSSVPTPRTAATTPPQDRVAPLDVYPMANDSLKPGGWAGINKPFKTRDGAGNVWVAKSNTLGDFAALHPDWTPAKVRHDNIREIVASHIMADEFHLPTLTFQEGYFNHNGQKEEKILSPLTTGFHTLEEVPVTAIKDGDTAVALTVVDGWMGDWDSTFNDSNFWVKANGSPMGSDYGMALEPGIQEDGVPFANRKIMTQFATRENVKAISDKITGLSDQDIHDMVARQGSKWIHDWNPQMEQDVSSALIANRDALKKHNPYTAYVQGFHPLLHSGLLKLKYPVFFYRASHAQFPPLNRPDQWLDVTASVASYAHLGWLEKIAKSLRHHVHSPQQQP